MVVQCTPSIFPISRLRGLVIFAQRQEGEMGVYQACDRFIDLNSLQMEPSSHTKAE
jgi:hypothetical protein